MSKGKTNTQSVYWRILQDIGELPPQWETTNIIDSTYIKGRIGWQGLKASEFTTVGPHLVTGTDFGNGKVNWDTCYHITISRFDEAPSIHLSNGDLLITKDGSIGKVAFVKNCPDKAILNSGIFVLRCSDKSYINKYLYYILTSQYFDKFISVALGGSTINHLYQREFEQFRFPIPSLPEQRKIARILSTVDEVIGRTEAAIGKYQAIKQGMMHDLFTRGLDHNGKLRPRREEAPELYHQTALGWLPKEWEVVETDERINVIDAQPDHRTPPEVSDGAPYVGIGDLKATGEIDFDRARKVAKAALQKQVASFDIYPGTFIFGKIGTLGQPTRIPSERFFAVSANVVLLTTKLREDADFIFWLYSSRLIDTQVTDTTNTTSQPALGIQRVRKFFIPWTACSEERDKIASRLETISKTLQNEERHRDKTLQVKQALMQALLTGRKAVVL